MKKMTFTQYGTPDVLHMTEAAIPTPQDDQVLVRMKASSVNFNTLHMVTGTPLMVRAMMGGLRKPKLTTPGNDVAGYVEAVGRAVTRLKPGDAVFGDTADHGYGAYAEYVAVPEKALTLKPATLSFEDAAAAPEAGLVALQGLRDAGRIQPGQHVLIVGASGGIGSFAVQLAKHFGAEVTAVCGPKNAELVRSLGADHVIDYTREDFARTGGRYDLILATAGYRWLFDYRRALKPGGRHVSAGGAMKQIFQALLLGPLASLVGRKKTVPLLVKTNKDLAFLGELMADRKIRAVIDRCYPLHEAPQALRHYGEGHARGKIIISMGA